MRSCGWLVIGMLALGACTTRPVVAPGEEAPCQCSSPISGLTLDNRADILFMIDNSSSMDAKQSSLRTYFPNFMAPLTELPTRPDLHIGIVTSDLGAGQYTPPSCGTVGGSQGMEHAGRHHLLDGAPQQPERSLPRLPAELDGRHRGQLQR